MGREGGCVSGKDVSGEGGCVSGEDVSGYVSEEDV